MRSINHVTLLGNLGKDPEIKITRNDVSVMILALATNHPRKVGDEWEERTEWHRIVVWGKDAERLDGVALKGSRMWVEGEIRTNKWTDKEGQTRYTTEITARRSDVLEKREATSGGADPSPEYRRWKGEGGRGRENARDHRRSGSPEPDYDDVPF